MLQDEAMHMSNEQAVQILKPMRDMMRDQHGCPISDAYFAIEKAIRALSTVSPDEVRGVGKWIHFTRKYISGVDDEGVPMIRCSVCDYTTFASSRMSKNYCPSCGAKMEVE